MENVLGHRGHLDSGWNVEVVAVGVAGVEVS